MPSAVRLSILFLLTTWLSGCITIGSPPGPSSSQSGGTTQPAVASEPAIVDPNGFVFFFDSGSAALSPDDAILIDTLADILRERPSAQALVVGHIDEAEFNRGLLDLDQRRIEAVQTQLLQRGISSDRIVLRAADFESPVQAVADRGADQAINRRVEVVYQVP